MKHEPDKIEIILAEAVKIDSVEERKRYLDEACGDDSQLRRDVEELVDVQCSIDRFFQNPAQPDNAISNSQGVSGETASESTSQPQWPHIGVLGDYQLVRSIGRGGMGVVYEAIQLSLNRRVALKVLPFAAVLDLRQLQRFKTEAQAAAGLHHENIVPVYQVGCERAVHFYAMQYIEGQNIGELIRQLKHMAEFGQVELDLKDRSDQYLVNYPAPLRLGFAEPMTRISESSPTEADRIQVDETIVQEDDRISPRESESGQPISGHSSIDSVTKPEFFRTIAGLGIQAAEALEYAHQRGVLHRDIKPSNLMLDAEGKLWVTDFGLARVDGDAGLTMTGDVMGTLRYMSPEQAGGRNAIVDQRTDVYSLGVTLYEMFTLQPIFGDCDRSELLQKRLQEEPIPPRQIKKSLPRDLETIVLTAIAKKVEDRYATAQELADDLRRFLENKPIQAKRPSLAKRVRKWGQRHRSLSASFFVLLLAVLISGSMLFGVINGNIRNAHENAPSKLTKSHHEPIGIPYAGEFLPGLLPEPMSVPEIGLWQIATKVPRSVLQSGVFSPDGSKIAMGEAGNIRIYDATNLRLLEILVGHAQRVTAIAWHPSGQILASASWDGTVRLWTVDGTPIHVLNGHVGEVNCVDWNPEGTQLASAGANGTIRLWNPDGTNAGLLRSHRNHVFCLAYSPDGKMLASAGGDILPPDENGNPGDNAIRLWNLAEKRVVASMEGHDLSVQCLAWRPDGLELASGGGNVFRSQGPTRKDSGTLRLWGIDGTAGPVLTGDHRGINALAWRPDGRQIVFGGRDETLWSWEPDQPGQIKKFTIHGTDINSIVWNSEGSQLLTTNRESMVQWESDGSLRHTLDGLLHGPRFLHVSFSPDGRWITTRGRLWQTDGTPGPRIEGIYQPTEWSPDGKWIAGVGPDSTVMLTNVDSTTSQLLSKHDRYITDIEWDPQGQRIASTSGDGTTRVWDLSSNTSQKLKTVDQKSRQFRSVEFSPTGQLIAAASWGDSAVHVWDRVGNIRALLKGHRGGIEAVSWSPDGSQLVTGGDLTVRLWDADGTLKNEFAGHTSEIYPVVWSPDGKWIASGSTKGTVRLWEANGNPGPVLTGHHGGIHSLAWSPDSKRLASASWLDGTLRMWNVETKKTEWMLLLIDGAGTTITLSASGELLHGDREVAKDQLIYLQETPTGKTTQMSYAEFHEKHAETLVRHLGKLGWIAARRGDYSEAVALCHQMMSYAPFDEHGMFRRRVANILNELLETHQYQFALPVISFVIQFDRNRYEADPENSTLRDYLIHDLVQRHDLYATEERYEEAIVDAEEIRRIEPQNSRGAGLSGHTRWKMKQYDLALNDFDDAYQITPDLPNVQVGLAFALLNHPKSNRSDAERAAELARQASVVIPKFDLSWSVLGMAEYRMGNWKEAIRVLDHSLQVSKIRSHGAEFFFLAMAHWQIEDKAKAINWYRRGVEWMESNDSKNPDLFRWRTETEELLGFGKTAN